MDIALIAFESFIVQDGADLSGPVPDITRKVLTEMVGEGLEVAEAFMPEGRLPYVGAYAFPLGSPLVEPFDNRLRELRESGEWLRMVEPFGFAAANEPSADLTVNLPCAG